MKVVVEILEVGKYRDVACEGEFVSAKGELRAVTPSYAAQLIKTIKSLHFILIQMVETLLPIEAAHENAKAFHDKCENDHPTNSSVG